MKRFVNQDVLLGAISDSQSLNRYAYTNGNPINRLDPFGLCAAMLKNLGHLALNLLSTILLFTPFAPLGALLAGINAAWYFYDGDILGGLCSLGIVLGGVGGLIGGTAGLIMSGCGNLLMAGTSTWSAGQSIGKMYMDYQETGKINPWDVVSATMNLGMAVMGGYGAFKSFSSIPAMGRINSKLESAWNARKTITELKYKPSSGAILKATSNKTTTIIGGYEKDMKYIVNEMGNVKSTYFGANEGGFNVLNVPDDMYKNADQFWNDINVKWLEEAIARDDVFIMATKPTEGATSFIDINTGTRKLTGFGREYEYLTGKGYVYDEISKTMIK